MKRYILTVFLLPAVFLAACGEDFTGSRYVLKLPDIPEDWENILGKPEWRAEWQNGEGLKKTAVIDKGRIAVSLPQTSANAVLALPFWPEKGINPGVFKPAGAIFPFDVSGKTLTLSWQGGLEAVFFRELAGAAENSAGGAVGGTSVRIPENFDWPRFRLLFGDTGGADPSVNAEVLADPWLADWRGIAEKTVLSGFDKRRMVPEPRGALEVPAGPGPWIGASPFAPPLFFENAEGDAGGAVFPVRPAGDTWVSREGLLRCNTETWIFHKWPE